MPKQNPKPRSKRQQDFRINPLVPLAERGEEILERCRKLSQRIAEQTKRLGIRSERSLD